MNQTFEGQPGQENVLDLTENYRAGTAVVLKSADLEPVVLADGEGSYFGLRIEARGDVLSIRLRKPQDADHQRETPEVLSPHTEQPDNPIELFENNSLLIGYLVEQTLSFYQQAKAPDTSTPHLLDTEGLETKVNQLKRAHAKLQELQKAQDEPDALRFMTSIVVEVPAGAVMNTPASPPQSSVA